MKHFSHFEPPCNPVDWRIEMYVRKSLQLARSWKVALWRMLGWLEFLSPDYAIYT